VRLSAMTGPGFGAPISSSTGNRLSWGPFHRAEDDELDSRSARRVLAGTRTLVSRVTDATGRVRPVAFEMVRLLRLRLRRRSG